MSNYRVTMFIGSSSEGHDVAKAVKSHFEADLDVSIWSENVFQLNESSLDSLLRATSLYDFAVLVLTPDDVLTSRGKKYEAARDNVIFEHGLFLGRLGPRRAFIICEKSVRILSDFAGITITFFEMPDRASARTLSASVKQACSQIKRAIDNNLKKAELGFYPSTSLAIGYFENFVSKVFRPLLEGEYVIKIDDKEQRNLNFDTIILTIIIPTSLSEVEKDHIYGIVQDKNLQQIVVDTPYRDFPFYVRGYSKDDKVLKLYDMPTTLLSSRKTIELILKKDYIGPSQEQEKLERSEIHNFRLALDHLLKMNFSYNYGEGIPRERSQIRLDGLECLNEIHSSS